jgi:hypothetical protein
MQERGCALAFEVAAAGTPEVLFGLCFVVFPILLFVLPLINFCFDSCHSLGTGRPP